MHYHPDDTICAIATAAGGAARGMVRVAGPCAVNFVTPLFSAADGEPLERRRQPLAVPGRLDISTMPSNLPCDLLVWPTDRSYTRQPMVELHTLGSSPLLESIVAAICAQGARLAEPGEFTLRAFLAGRIDLTQAEAVLGVIDASSGNELASALAQMAGGLARPLQALREDLLQLLAELEAGLDFVDEDIEFVSLAEITRRLQAAAQTLDAIAEKLETRHVSPSDTQIVLLGRPNAGKSTLFNALTRKFGVRDDANTPQAAEALVSHQRGTTRDYLTAAVLLGGIRCEIVDTAGIDEPNEGHCATTSDGTTCARSDSAADISTAARDFAKQRRERATLRVFCVEAQHDMKVGGLAAQSMAHDFDMLVLTKCDLLSRGACAQPFAGAVPTVMTSGVSDQGIDELGEALRSALVSEQIAPRGQAVAATAGRCRESIRLASSAIHRALEIASPQSGNELVALELRVALQELGKVVGVVYTDDLLDRIFSTFCIGK